MVAKFNEASTRKACMLPIEAHHLLYKARANNTMNIQSSMWPACFWLHEDGLHFPNLSLAWSHQSSTKHEVNCTLLCSCTIFAVRTVKILHGASNGMLQNSIKLYTLDCLTKALWSMSSSTQWAQDSNNFLRTTVSTVHCYALHLGSFTMKHVKFHSVSTG